MGDTAGAAVALVTARAQFAPDTQYGISAISGESLVDPACITSDLCPTMDFSKIAILNEQAAADAEATYKHLDAMVQAFDSEDYATLNSHKNDVALLLPKFLNIA